MTSEAGQQIITIFILSYISRSKGNQTMKFGQLIEYNTKDIFHEKPYTKCGEEASPRPCYKKSKLGISLECYKICFSYMSKSRSTKIY